MAASRRRAVRLGAVLVSAWPEWAFAFHAQRPTNSLKCAIAAWARHRSPPRRSAPNLTMLSGPGGNVVVSRGADGKVVVDTFVQPAWTT